tara:strand:+ start:356 stop:706 length:351 start_codon:yes stop_codon:yes gene_type:complete
MTLDDALDAPQIQTLRQGDTDGVRIDYSDQLRSGETLSSVTSVSITGGSTNVTASAAAVSSTTLTILGQTVAAANAITFTVTVGSTAAAGLYTATVTAATSNSRTMVRRSGFNIVS